MGINIEMEEMISVVLCTYNGGKLLEDCIKSILNQNYRNFELLCVDGMSEDKTPQIINEFSKRDTRVKFILNKERLAEGKGKGKSLGYELAKGKVIAFIDQDNILQDKDLFLKASKELKNSFIVGVLGGLTHDYSDTPVIRYVSLFGTDSFFAYRSLDFLYRLRSNLTVNSEAFLFPMSERNMPLTGGNCFFYKKSDLKKIGGYDQDVILMKRMISDGKNAVAIIPDATKHYAERSIYRLIKKKFTWANKVFSRGRNQTFQYLPQSASELAPFTRNFLFSIFIVPNLYYSLRLFWKFQDKVILLFPILSFLNLIAYGLSFIKSKINSLFRRELV